MSFKLPTVFQACKPNTLPCLPTFCLHHLPPPHQHHTALHTTTALPPLPCRAARCGLHCDTVRHIPAGPIAIRLMHSTMTTADYRRYRVERYCPCRTSATFTFEGQGDAHYGADHRSYLMVTLYSRPPVFLSCTHLIPSPGPVYNYSFTPLFAMDVNLCPLPRYSTCLRLLPYWPLRTLVDTTTFLVFILCWYTLRDGYRCICGTACLHWYTGLTFRRCYIPHTTTTLPFGATLRRRACYLPPNTHLPVP